MDGASSSASIPSRVQGLCPCGWHIPSDEEWKALEMQLGFSQAAADSMGSRGSQEALLLKANTGWNNNANGSNSTGLTVVPAGVFDSNFSSLGAAAFFWTATEGATGKAKSRSLHEGHAQINRADENKGKALSCRCVKD